MCDDRDNQQYENFVKATLVFAIQIFEIAKRWSAGLKNLRHLIMVTLKVIAPLLQPLQTKFIEF